MVTSANAQRLLCRIMIAAWLIAVCGMAVAALGERRRNGGEGEYRRKQKLSLGHRF